ncbi:winged helix-turn-helix transcriptional regulator [Amycolatopsis anabasis]|uniref:winged helix-turn-helix transcriptional regulator n=1 Tax=Amycolatopsis anabasis TaxID=1840409 RepID=UPI00131DDE3B|nr:helix-turn-helix domain-containing protein [Amycolatopsis anabasis]
MRGGSPVSTGAQDPMGDLFNSECPGRVILEHITSRWATLILAALRCGPLRFFELREKIGGISEKMLSQNLRTLVRDGLISRTVEPYTPPRVSYELTDLGRGLTRPLQQLVRWISVNGDEILAAQDRYDQQNAER